MDARASSRGLVEIQHRVLPTHCGLAPALSLSQHRGRSSPSLDGTRGRTSLRVTGFTPTLSLYTYIYSFPPS
jgi:hypothetical protein